MEIIYVYGVIAVISLLAVLLFIKTISLKERIRASEEQLKSTEDQLAQKRDGFNDLKKDLTHVKSKLNDQINENDSLSVQLSELRPYTHIKDAEAEASRLIQQAETKASQTLKNTHDLCAKLKSDAEKIKDGATIEAKAVIKEAREKSKDSAEKADLKLQTANEQYVQILANARSEAERIAGDAFAAKENADLWEAAATSAKNLIEGYGDEYLIPAQSLLDQLADDFDHKDAGVKLKESRAHTKMLIKQGHAAECEYVETRRKETAIRFVLDAYNGKVDSILSKVKRDNYGKLKQQLDDAFQLVNFNGAAFRNACITRVYHTSRVEELEWGVRATELQALEREEQRRIKEQMREEEKARREFQKALKEAEKEEKMLQTAMDKAREELQSASDEQRQQYELQLAELEERLLEAEARNERALSMAQQTRRGHVYVISNVGSFGEHVYKVGMTRRLEPMDRVKELGDASVPFSFDVHAMIYSEDAPALEKELHRKFNYAQVNKVNPRKEFFRVMLSDIREIVDGIEEEVHWTMTAEAAEFRESQAIERAMEGGKQLSDVAPEIAVH